MLGKILCKIFGHETSFWNDKRYWKKTGKERVAVCLPPGCYEKEYYVVCKRCKQMHKFWF